MREISNNSLALLNELEDFLLPRKKFTFGYFPLIRIQLGYYLHLIKYKKIDLNQLNHSISFDIKKFKFKDTFNLIILWVKVSFLSLRYRNLLNNKILLFSFLENYYQQENDEKVNIYISPIIKEFVERPVPYEELIISKTSWGIETTDLKSFYNLLHKYYNLLFLFKSKIFSTHKGYISNTEVIESFFSNKNIVQTENFLNQIYRTQISQDVNYNVFKTILKITNPKSIWTYCYYENNVMALIRAANKLKINNIEYQHSQQSDEHFAYAKWNHIDIYKEYFPSTFWVWEQRDADRIRKNFEGENYKPNIIVGGNIAVIQEKEKYMEKAADAEKGILVSLQGVWIPEFVEKVIEQDHEHTWYFRQHPRNPEDEQKMIDFKSRFPDKVEIELANSLSLYQLFTKVKVNIVDFSGTALEAEQFCVQNIVTGLRGRDVYADKINSGLFYFADDEVLLKKAIETIKGIDVDLKKSVLDERKKLKKIVVEVFA